MPKQSTASVEATSFLSLDMLRKLPTSENIKGMGSDTLSSLSKLLRALQDGFDLSKFGLSDLSDDQKDTLIKTILALIIFLRRLKRGDDITDLALSFSNIVVNLISPTKVLDAICDLFTNLGKELRQIWDSFKEGYDSFESQADDFSFSDILSSVFLRGKDFIKKLDHVLQDRIITSIQLFLTKVVSIWFTVKAGLIPEDINMETLTELSTKSYTTLKDSTDIIDMIYSSLCCVSENWNELIHGNFACVFLGKTESAKYEATCAKIEGMYKIVKAKNSDLLKEEHGHTYESFNQLVLDTLRTGQSYIKTHTGAVLAVLKSSVSRLEIIRAELLLAIQQESLKPQPFGVLLYGGSSTGKSTVQDTLAQTIIGAHEIEYSPGMIASVNYADKYDSSTTSDTKVTLADDVGNAQSREDFSERIIDHINSQRRVINKAAVEEKGVHFYNNIGHIVSTNDHLMSNVVKSCCKESVFRRFPVHVHVKVKPQYRKVKGDENSGFSAERTVDLTAAERLDAYEFSVYEFKSMADADDEPEVDIICGDQEVAKHIKLDGMWFEEIKLPESDAPTLEQLKHYIFIRTKELHVQALQTLASLKAMNDAKTCFGCGMTDIYCQCEVVPESQARLMGNPKPWFGELRSMTTSRLVSAHAEITAGLSLRDPRPAIKLAAKRVQMVQYAYSNKRECMNHILMSSWKYMVAMFWLFLSACFAYDLDNTFLFSINFLFLCFAPFVWIRYALLQEKARIESEITSRPGMLTYLVPESSWLREERAKAIFKWFPAVVGAYMVYRFFRNDFDNQNNTYTAETSNTPHTPWQYTKEKLNSAPSMTQSAHTTTGDHLKQKVSDNMAIVTCEESNGKKSHAISLPVKGNYYLVPTHILPLTGKYDLTFYPKGLNSNEGKAKVPSVSNLDLSPIVGSDYTIVRVVSSAPRWDLTKHLPLNKFEKRLGTYITQHLSGEMSEEKTWISRYTRLGVGASVTTRQKALITNAYTLELSRDTTAGMCGSAFIDETRGVLLGLHSAGRGKTAILSSLTYQDVETALTKFDSVYQPTSQATLDIGSEQGYTLASGDKWMNCQVENEEYNMPVLAHTWINHGVVLKHGVPEVDAPQSPFCKSDYLQAVTAEFGPTKVGPPQEMTADYHKKKAAIDYNTPKQDFASVDVKRAVDDYLGPILEKINLMKRTDPELFAEVKRELSVQEALDGVGEQGLTGINNSTSIGWPYSGKKKKYMVMDELDPNTPLMPRSFYEDLYPLEERIKRIRKNARMGQRSNFIVKTCSKANELLPLEKKKCRPFQAMGTDVLVSCRQIFAPMVRFFGANKYLTECMLGINMKSHEAGEFRDFMTHFNEDMCIAGDFKAYDRNMSAQITSAAAEIIVQVLKAFDYTDSQLELANALLTEIIYPHMNFYGQVFEMANSNPSGQPLTTHLNSIANSLYTRIIFYELCPDEEDFRRGVKLGTYGDDNAMNVANRLRGIFTHTEMARVYRDRYGMTYTMDKKDAESTPYQNFDELGFLKCRIVYNVDYQAYVPLLDQSSIVKSLHWQKKAKDCEDPPQVQFSSKIDSGVREASHYGRNFYDGYARKIRNIKAANPIALAALNVPTYEQVVNKNKWAFHPEWVNDDDCEVFDSQSSTWQEPISNHMFAWRTGKLVAYLVSGEFVWSVLPWKQIVCKLPKKCDLLLAFQHESITIMDANELLTYLPAVNAGRFEVTPFNDRHEYAADLLNKKKMLEMVRFIVFPSTLSSIYQTHTRVCNALQKVHLSYHTLPIREAPITFLLTGGSSLGKTGLAMKIVKQALHSMGYPITADDNGICILNETDDFQSEYTSDTKAVIFDDVANDKPDKETQNPLRKLLDYSNNVCKMALAPEADKKGIVAIRPKAVMVTSNAPATELFCKDNVQFPVPNDVSGPLNVNEWSVAPFAYARRFDISINVLPSNYQLSKNSNEDSRLYAIDWENDGPSFWNFQIIKYTSLDGYSIKTNVVDTYMNIYQLMEYVDKVAKEKQRSQRAFIEESVRVLDSPPCVHGIIAGCCQQCIVDAGGDPPREYVIPGKINDPNVMGFDSQGGVFSSSSVPVEEEKSESEPIFTSKQLADWSTKYIGSDGKPTERSKAWYYATHSKPNGEPLQSSNGVEYFDDGEEYEQQVEPFKPKIVPEELTCDEFRAYAVESTDDSESLISIPENPDMPIVYIRHKRYTGPTSIPYPRDCSRDCDNLNPDCVSWICVDKYSSIEPMLSFFDVVFHHTSGEIFSRTANPNYSPFIKERLRVKKFNMFDERNSVSEIRTIELSSRDMSSIKSMLWFYDVVRIDDVAYVATRQAAQAAIDYTHYDSVIMCKRDDYPHHDFHQESMYS